MKVLLTTAVWGKKNREIFAYYSLASLLSKGNIPALKPTLHILTTPEDQAWLLEQPSIQAAEALCDIEWELFDKGAEGREKYSFLSRLQNRAIQAALEYDCIVFNYADFIWADGSLPNAVKLLGDTDAVLSFCLPVDESSGIGALEQFRTGHTVTVSNRKLAKLALGNLHIEATYRYWDAEQFTRFPSYLLFKVPDHQGVVIRAYHQTALVFRVKKTCELFRQGILGGTLDGDFTSDIASRGKVVHAQNSDEILVCSLHDGFSLQDWHGASNHEVVLREFVERRASEQQRQFAKAPISVKINETDKQAWRDVVCKSQGIVVVNG